jgi:hypothetical protein
MALSAASREEAIGESDEHSHVQRSGLESRQSKGILRAVKLQPSMLRQRGTFVPCNILDYVGGLGLRRGIFVSE